MQLHSRIFDAGHRGMVGAAIVRDLLAGGHDNFLVLARGQVALRGCAAVEAIFVAEKRGKAIFIFAVARVLR